MCKLQAILLSRKKHRKIEKMVEQSEGDNVEEAVAMHLKDLNHLY